MSKFVVHWDYSFRVEAKDEEEAILKVAGQLKTGDLLMVHSDAFVEGVPE